MKTLLLFFGLIMASSLFAQEASIIVKGKTTEATFWVNGNCNMCKKRIESALELTGIKTSEYDFKTNMLFVAFRNDKYELKDIHNLVANAGHDTFLVSAPDSVYKKLHHCCLYPRLEPNTK